MLAAVAPVARPCGAPVAAAGAAVPAAGARPPRAVLLCARAVRALPACRARGLRPPRGVARARARGRGPFAGAVLRPHGRCAAAVAWPSSRGSRARVASEGRLLVGVAGRRGGRGLHPPLLPLLLRSARASSAPDVDLNSWCWRRCRHDQAARPPYVNHHRTGSHDTAATCSHPDRTALNVSGASSLHQAGRRLRTFFSVFSFFAFFSFFPAPLLGCLAAARGAGAPGSGGGPGSGRAPGPGGPMGCARAGSSSRSSENTEDLLAHGASPPAPPPPGAPGRRRGTLVKPAR